MSLGHTCEGRASFFSFTEGFYENLSSSSECFDRNILVKVENHIHAQILAKGSFVQNA